ncbi:MAG: hypothetical protein RLZ12_181 [Bacillota bacterium]
MSLIEVQVNSSFDNFSGLGKLSNNLLTCLGTNPNIFVNKNAEILTRYKPKISIFHANVASVASYSSHCNYNIGFLLWELKQVPQRLVGRLAKFNELWVHSTFNMQQLAMVTTSPVYLLPTFMSPVVPSVLTNVIPQQLRNRFLFLYMFNNPQTDYDARKNPEAVLEAFMRAFPLNDTRVALIIKTTPNAMGRYYKHSMEQMIDKNPNIHVIYQVLSAEQNYALMNECDAFVSLHRGEGFGMCLAEAMSFGKPVICTNWSANTDFAKPDNACLVNYSLVPLERSYLNNVYNKGNYWAEPDVEQAANYMKKLVEDEEYYRKLSKQSANFMHYQYNFNKINSAINSRINEIIEKLSKETVNVAGRHLRESRMARYLRRSGRYRK